MLIIGFVLYLWLWAFIGIVFVMFVVGVRFLVRGLDSKSGNQWLQPAGALILLPPSIYFFYRLDPEPVDSALRSIRTSRSCRRYTEVDLPEAPVRSLGIELTTDTKSDATIADREIAELAHNPFLYLGGKGIIGFQFVEVRGQRFTGTAEHFSMVPYSEPEARYRLFVGYVPGEPSPFQLTLSERESNRRIGSIVGFQTTNKQCPTYSDTKKQLRKMIIPSAPLPSKAPPIQNRLHARVIMPPVTVHLDTRSHLLDDRVSVNCPKLSTYHVPVGELQSAILSSLELALLDKYDEYKGRQQLH